MTRKKALLLPLMMVLVMGGVIIRLSSNIQNQMEESAALSVRETVQLISGSMQYARERDIAQVYDLASTLRFDGYLAETLGQARGNGTFSWAAVAAADTGQGINYEGEPFDISDLPVEERALQGERDVSAVFVNSQGLWTYMVQCPLYEEGRLAGALYAEISMESYGSVLPDTFYGDEGMLYLLDVTSRRFVVQPRSTEMHISSRYDLENFLTAFGVADTDISEGIMDSIDSGQWRIVRIHFDKEHSYMFFWPVDGSGWYLCGIVPESSIQRESMAVGRTICLVIFLMLLSALIFMWMVRWSIRQKEQIEKGQRQYRMELFNGIARSINDAVLMFDCATGRNEIVFENIEHMAGAGFETIQELARGEEFRQKYEGTVFGQVLSGHPIDPRTSCTEKLEWDNLSTGEKHWIHVEVLCVELMGTPKCIMSVYDITQEAVMEDSLRTTALAAQNANRVKSEFLSHMSHEIRTPLNAVFGMLQLARGSVDQGGDPRDYLAKAEGASKQLLSLVNDILDLSRIESGKMLLAEEPFRLDELLERVCGTAGFQTFQKHQTFTMDLSECRAVEAVGDEVRLNQILTNLLGNAVKYTPEGGTISLSVHSSPGQTEGYRQYAFAVADNGYGMSEEFQQRMFLPFERETLNCGKKESGTGLGLSIVNNLVSLMGGFIQVKSGLGKGSVFTVSIGFKSGVAADKEMCGDGQRELDLDLSGWHILLVEDNELNLEITTEFLKMTHAQVDCAENGLQAYEAFGKSPEGYYDLILMDMQMPVWDGLQATRAIRALGRPDAARVPIIATTANAFLEDEKECLASGMDDYITKPLDQQKLYKKIERYREEHHEI